MSTSYQQPEDEVHVSSATSESDEDDKYFDVASQHDDTTRRDASENNDDRNYAPTEENLNAAETSWWTFCELILVYVCGWMVMYAVLTYNSEAIARCCVSEHTFDHLIYESTGGWKAALHFQRIAVIGAQCSRVLYVLWRSMTAQSDHPCHSCESYTKISPPQATKETEADSINQLDANETESSAEHQSCHGKDRSHAIDRDETLARFMGRMCCIVWRSFVRAIQQRNPDAFGNVVTMICLQGLTTRFLVRPVFGPSLAAISIGKFGLISYCDKEARFVVPLLALLFTHEHMRWMRFKRRNTVTATP